ncbi:hypothetical protein [Spirosoma montaniterrae]|uniref:Outer membrane protein beta-barrel domain-containing protein n=1 Tax=Spirosoma montaniterrae TaxID=1178516 RepID=A0A1P9X316_9BACT|nr:hypothetical protein [Spirosoma montaniterrae]AQG81988.1 hypothetical protein AWR27_23430 [Spirosoma montaniterrae]
MKLFWILTTALLINVNLSSFAQDGTSVGGEWASGVRLGGSSGVTLKKYSKNNQSAFELIGSYNFDPKVNNLGITALFEKLPALSGNRLNAQIGFGPTWIFRNTHIGISGILGFDWRLKQVPISLSVDWAPTFFFINRTGFSPINGAFSARYILNSRNYMSRRPRMPKPSSN